MTWTRKPASHARRTDLRRVSHLEPWQCVFGDCPRIGCNAETCVCPPCGCPTCDERRKRASTGRISDLPTVKPERPEVQQALFIIDPKDMP